MQGVVFAGDGNVELATFDDPVPGPNDVVLEIKASGMCGSDLKFYRPPVGASFRALGRPYNGEIIIAGHEPCGVVAAIGKEVDGRTIRIGDRMMVHHYAGCNFCDSCRTGWTQMCDQGAVIFGVTGHGGHAAYMKVPANTLVRLPDELSFSTGAAISCGTGTAFGALVRMNVTAHDRIAIFGQGPVGLSATQLAAAMGAEVIAIDVNSERTRRAGAFGATHVIDAGSVDPVGAILALTGGRGASRTLDTSGAPAGREAAIRATAAWGISCMVGEGGAATLDASRDMIRKQLTVIGSWTFSSAVQGDCARFIARHGVAVDQLFTDRWTIAQADQAYREFDRQAGGKGVFTF